MFDMPAEMQRDRYIEALLACRLMYAATPAGGDFTEARVTRYWDRMYKRWAELYHGPNGSAPDDNPTAAAIRHPRRWGR